jgi:hypothetical protein
MIGDGYSECLKPIRAGSGYRPPLARFGLDTRHITNAPASLAGACRQWIGPTSCGNVITAFVEIPPCPALPSGSGAALLRRDGLRPPLGA